MNQAIAALRTRLLSLSLRTHLLLLALLLSLPALALILHSGVVQRQEAIRKGNRDARRLVTLIANEQYNQVGNAEQLLVVLAQLPDIRNRKVADVNSLLGEILRKNPQFGNIVVTDREGMVWASGLPMGQPFSLRERLMFRATRQSGAFSSGEYVVGRLSVKHTIGFGYPIENEQGEWQGVISANLDFERLVRRLLTTTELPKKSQLTIVDRNGTIVFSSQEPERFVGTPLKPALLRRMAGDPAKDRDTFFDETDQDDRRIISYRVLRLPHETDPYLYVCASVPLDGVMRKARQAELVNMGLLATVLLAAFVLTLVIGNVCFVQRVKRLQEASARLAEGELQVRVADLVGGGELGELGRAFDEMARKLAAREQELSDLNRDLLKRVAEETERRVSHERLLARHIRLAAMGEMIGAIAHQWRQPLATLGATIQSLRMAWEHRCLDERFLEKAEADAQKQLYYMSDTIEDFRNFFSPEKVVERFDVTEKVGEVLQLVAAQFANSNVTLEIVAQAGHGRLTIRGYQNEFKQALLNLVSNAFDAVVERMRSAAGQERHGTTPLCGRVTIALSAAEDWVVVEVDDNGCGIPSEYADKVFDPYFTSKSEGKGTGIGLYMSRLIIEESMGGRLCFTSSPEGTQFRIELPREAGRGGENDV